MITGLKTELREALEQQRATAQVLQVINASHGNLEPIFDIILENAIDLCGAKFGVLFLHDGKVFTVEAARNVPPAYEETVRGQAFAPGTNPVLHHLQEHKAPFQVKDVFDEAYVARDPLRVAAIELAGVRSLVAVPLLKGAELIGFVGIYRDKPGGFADGQIALVSAFADQAVIAIENARLLSEQHEALESRRQPRRCCRSSIRHPVISPRYSTPFSKVPRGFVMRPSVSFGYVMASISMPLLCTVHRRGMPS